MLNLEAHDYSPFFWLCLGLCELFSRIHSCPAALIEIGLMLLIVFHSSRTRNRFFDWLVRSLR